MNDQLEPIDSNIREHLTRRSTGRLPEGLEGQVSKALDAAPARGRTGWPSLRLTLPRLAGAGVAMAFVATLVVALGAPALRGGPAGSTGYPYNRALTTDQLVSLLAGPQPAINTAFVVTTTIDLRNDVCPMDRYPTVGVIHGVSPQICVMEAGLSPQLTGTTVTGTFAFRFLGGSGSSYLGLIGQVTPASSGLAYRVTDEWPLDGKAFVVEGYLGAYPQTCPSTYSLPAPGDPLNPSGDDPCWQDWLSADGSPAPAVYPATDAGGSASGTGGGAATTDGPVPADATPSTPPWMQPAGATPSTQPSVQPRPTAPATPTSSFDALALYGKARFVQAGGARQIDSVTHDTTYGTWVVKPVTSGCPGASPVDSRGCTVWRVMARVNDVLNASPTPSTATDSASPSAPASPIAPATPVASGLLTPALTGVVGPGGRPLTAAELNALRAAKPSSLVGRIAIVKGPVPLGACPVSASPEPSKGLCVDLAWISSDGYWAVRVEANGSLTPIGQLAAGNGSPLPLSAATPSGDLVLVDAWLDWMPSLECDQSPYPSDSLCGAGAVTSVLTNTPLATQEMALNYPSFPADTYGVVVAQGAYQIFGSGDLKARPIHGLYLLRGTEILARVVPIGS